MLLLLNILKIITILRTQTWFWVPRYQTKSVAMNFNPVVPKVTGRKSGTTHLSSFSLENRLIF